jgi:hypothetical protein
MPDMQAPLINEKSEHTFALILESGDEVAACLERFATGQHLAACEPRDDAEFIGVRGTARLTEGLGDFRYMPGFCGTIGLPTSCQLALG